LFAQNQRQANITGGGDSRSGKCTMEVVVDDVAQVEIRGSNATLRTISGQPAQWRRFVCTSVMPQNPSNLHFAGVDGRGRVDLIRDARNGVVVLEIQDKQGGREGYTFDITWDSRDYNQGQFNEGRDRYPNNPGASGESERYRYPSENRPNVNDGEYYRRYGHAFGTDEAVRVCQQAVLTQATSRFHSANIHFNRTRLNDSPGRNDSITGSFDVHLGQGRERTFGFACSVNLDNGRVRSAEVSERPLDDPNWR